MAARTAATIGDGVEVKQSELADGQVGRPASGVLVAYVAVHSMCGLRSAYDQCAMLHPSTFYMRPTGTYYLQSTGTYYL